jgi:ABC-type phosphate transport system substrate-binding protein
MKNYLLIPLLFLPLAAFAPEARSQEGAPSFYVIVNSQNPIESLDPRVLSDIFLKKMTQWPEDGLIQPVDLEPNSAVRRRFCQQILSRSVTSIRNYWQQLIFSGRNVPPPELRNDGEVIEYVARNPGAIGYVSASALGGGAEPNGIKIVGIK